MNCPRCGAPLNTKGTGSYTCEYCGETVTLNSTQGANEKPAVDEEQIKQQLREEVREEMREKEEKEKGIGCLLGGLCFFIPLLGLILFFVYKTESPKKAKGAIVWGSIGLILYILSSACSN